MKLYVADRQLYIQGTIINKGEEFIIGDKMKINKEYATYQNQISRDKAKETKIKTFEEIKDEKE
jgi:hypothetical protein